MKTIKTMRETPKLLFGFSPWVMLGIAVILGLAITVLTMRNAEREKRNMVDGFVARGEALIWALEAGSRTWMGFKGESRLLQMLIEETAEQPGLKYIAVVSPEGVVLAHSDSSLVGSRLGLNRVPDKSTTQGQTRWTMVEDNGADIFEVYRKFAPVEGGHHPFSGYKPGHHGGHSSSQAMPDSEIWERQAGVSKEAYQDADQAIVLVGLDRQPFEEALEADFYSNILSAVVVAFMALGALISVFWAYHYRRSRRQLELEVTRNERLTALGHMAAGVAHEIRNPLSSIKGLATYLAQKFPHDGKGVEAANTLIGEVERLNRVVSELLEFAKPAALKLTPGNPEEVVSQALRLAEADIKSKQIRVHLSFPERLPSVPINVERLTQALLNLFLNAVQAMESEGTLSIALSEKDGGLQLVVSDTGPGLSEELMESIFTPYFTTKSSGTGLGLAIVKQIIEGHHGRITVKSGHSGSSFIIVLPLK